MKKFLLLFALVAFLGNFVAPTFATNHYSKSVVIDGKHKCPKCGKEDCDGKCDQKKCDKSKDGKGCSKDAKAEGCCKKGTGEAGCAKKCPHAGNGGCCKHAGAEKSSDEKTPVPNK